MIITIAGFKGGVGKTTTAIHIAAYLQEHAPTVLVDGDPNRSATTWARQGKLPFKVVDERAAARFAREYEHLVIDTKARPDEEDLQALVEGCDLLVIPTKPDALSLDALRLTVSTLKTIGASNYRILLTIVPPKPSRDGDEARAVLEKAGLPLFTSSIRRFKAFEDAAAYGVTINALTGNPRAHEGWSDYAQAGAEIHR